MDAIELFRQTNRLCDTVRRCDQCPINGHCIHNHFAVTDKEAEELVGKIEQWAKKHPPKTRQSEFLKLFPKAQLKDGVIWVCPKYVEEAYEPPQHCFDIACVTCKRDFWLKEIKE